MTRQPDSRHNAPGYLLTNEAAAILQVSPKTVSRWARDGQLPFTRTLGGHRRYPEDEIRELAKGMRMDPTAGPLAGPP